MKIKLNWPISIFVIISIFLIIKISIIIYSQYNQVSLVSEDYYQEEIEYQQQIDRIERAKSLTHPLQWKLLKSEKKVYLKFPDDMADEKLIGEVYFFRPSDSHLDFRKKIEISADNEQFIDIKNIAKGYWKVKIFWSVKGIEYYEEGFFNI